MNEDKKVDLNNKNIRRCSITKNKEEEEEKKKKGSLFSKFEKYQKKTSQMESNNSMESLDQNILDLNILLQKQENHMYNLNLIEQRNVANHSELRQISRDMHKQAKGETNNEFVNQKEEEKKKEEKIEETRKKPPSLRKGKKHRETINTRKITEVFEENSPTNTSPSNKRMTKRDINKMSIIKVHTRNQGTNV